jgi:hypothetical protein
MIAAIIGRGRPRAARFAFALAVSAVLGKGDAVYAQDSRPAETVAAAQATSLGSFSVLPAVFEKKYPSVRSVVVARGNCIVFEYYRKDLGVAIRSPVYSVTKSVLSVLVGIAMGGQDENRPRCIFRGRAQKPAHLRRSEARSRRGPCGGIDPRGKRELRERLGPTCRNGAAEPAVVHCSIRARSVGVNRWRESPSAETGGRVFSFRRR